MNPLSHLQPDSHNHIKDIPQLEDPKIAVEIHDVTVSYNRRPVLWGIDCTIPAGLMTAIIGPNGAGKSTLLKTMMGLLPVSSGYVRFFNKTLQEMRPQISYMPQRESVDWDFPISVYDVVMMGRYGKTGLFRRPRQADRQSVEEALEKVGMMPYAQRQISRLSGGQQQRVFMARALAQDAQIYLMDEPFAGVDAATGQAIIKVLKDMRHAGKTIVVVHHDLQAVADSFDYAVLLNLRLVKAGSIKQVLNEQTLQETYGGRLNILAEVGQLLEQQQRGMRQG
jgi:manganese/zinc/iron transport system ATP- binding protein